MPTRIAQPTLNNPLTASFFAAHQRVAMPDEFANDPFRWVHCSPCASVLSDSSGAIVAINRIAELLFNTTIDAVRGKLAASAFALTDRDLESGPDLSRPSQFATIFRSLRLSDGTTVALVESCAWLRDEPNPQSFKIQIFQVIPDPPHTDPKTEQLAAFPHWNPNPVLEFGPHGNLTYSNRAAADLARSLGWPAVNDILPESSPNIVMECLASGKPRLRLELSYGERVISWSFFPIRPLNVVHCYAGEVTERHRLELQFRQSQKLESLGRLAGGVAHDFNNLLTVIRGQASLVASGQVTPEALAEALDQIQLAAERGSRLTRQLLTFSRQQVVQFGNADLNVIIQHVQKLLSRVVGEHIQILVRACEPLPAVWSDPSMMEQVLRRR